MKQPPQLKGYKPPRKSRIVKKEEKLEEARTVGRLKGENRFKNTKAGWFKSLRDHVGKAVDNIPPLEALALVGTTILVKKAIDESQELSNSLMKPREQLRKWVMEMGEAKGVAPPTAQLGAGFSAWIDFNPMIIWFGNLPDWVDWLIAYSIAFMLVRHGGQVLGLLGKGLDVIAKLFLIPGATAAAA